MFPRTREINKEKVKEWDDERLEVAIDYTKISIPKSLAVLVGIIAMGVYLPILNSFWLKKIPLFIMAPYTSLYGVIGGIWVYYFYKRRSRYETLRDLLEERSEE